MINTAMTFYAGQERCQRLGGHLVHVNTLREQLFLEDFLRQILQAAEQQGSFLHPLQRDRHACIVLYFFNFFNL